MKKAKFAINADNKKTDIITQMCLVQKKINRICKHNTVPYSLMCAMSGHRKVVAQSAKNIKKTFVHQR